MHKREHMTVAIMQPYFFPYLGYWQLVESADTFVIYDDGHYRPRGFINRNSILIDGLPHLLTLSLVAKSCHKLINEIEVGNNAPDLLKTISMAYLKAPRYKEVMPLITSILEYPEKNLAKFVGNSVVKISEFLELDTAFVYSSDIKKEMSLSAKEKVVLICKELGATKYVNAIGGQEFYDKQWFAEQGLELFFIQSTFTEYKQFYHPFVPHLSIIDLMMFNSKEEVKRFIKDDYTLI